MGQRRPPRSIWRYDFGKYAFFILLLVGFLIAFVVQSFQVLPGLIFPTATLVVTFAPTTVAIAAVPTEVATVEPSATVDDAPSATIATTITPTTIIVGESLLPTVTPTPLQRIGDTTPTSSEASTSDVTSSLLPTPTPNTTVSVSTPVTSSIAVEDEATPAEEYAGSVGRSEATVAETVIESPLANGDSDR